MANEEQKIEPQLTEAEASEARSLAIQSHEYARIKAKNLDFMDQSRWATMGQMAQAFIQSGALPKSMENAPKVIMALQAGYEAGIKPIEALNSFYFVNGKISMYGDTAIRQVIRAGHKVEWGKCDGETATVTITRGDTGATMTNTFTMTEAKKRGMVKDIWLKFPENMLKFKAFGMTARFLCPDALMGISIKEDIEGSENAFEDQKVEKISYRKSLEETLAAKAIDPEATQS